jgi:exodeoxyribonuclease VII large subunit
MKEQLKTKRMPFEKAIGELNLLSPLRLMDRGYSLAYDRKENELIKSTKQVSIGTKVDIRLKDGTLLCLVEDTEPME